MLYQTVRPKKFEDIVGNEATITALKAVLYSSEAKRPHAFLLHGPTGCGKTTIAKIIASQLNCEATFGLMEINAANTRGIDTIRNIAESIDLAPMTGRSKVYIFDESHQLTPQAQQGLLKVVEDCPIHAYFIFCTTEPNNIIKTIRNRCTELQVSRLPEHSIKTLLENVVQETKMKVIDDILDGISYVADGSPRRALVLLQQVAGIEDMDVVVEILEKGTDSQVEIWDICKILFSAPKIRRKKWKEALEILSLLDEDSESTRRAILSYIHKKLMDLDDSDVDSALDVMRVINIMSTNTFYGGKSILASLVLKACIGNE